MSKNSPSSSKKRLRSELESSSQSPLNPPRCQKYQVQERHHEYFKMENIKKTLDMMEEGSKRFCEKNKDTSSNSFNTNNKENVGNPVKYKFKDVKTDETKVIFLNSQPQENNDIPSPPETTVQTSFKHYTIESYFGKPKIKTVSNMK